MLYEIQTLKNDYLVAYEIHKTSTNIDSLAYEIHNIVLVIYLFITFYGINSDCGQPIPASFNYLNCLFEFKPVLTVTQTT